MEAGGPIHVETLDDLGVGVGSDRARGPLVRNAKATAHPPDTGGRRRTGGR